MPRWFFSLVKIAQQLWIRIALFSIAAILTAVLALWLGQWVPATISSRFGGDAVHLMLTTLSSSMLVIATFSLGTMVSAQAAATSNATPRAAPLMMSEDHAQNALSVFVGTFVYSIIVLVAIEVGIYSEGGRAIIFFTTLLTLVLVVFTLVRWIDELGQLGQMNDTLDLIENGTSDALKSHVAAVFTHTQPFSHMPGGLDVTAEIVGYVQLVDLEAIIRIAQENRQQIYLRSQTGTMTYRGRILCRIVAPDIAVEDKDSTDEMIRMLRETFVIGSRRTLLQDPRFGMTMLAEVAARALSPGVNDPGTAVDVIVVATRIIDQWHQLSTDHQVSASDKELSGGRNAIVFANPLTIDDLMAAAFMPVVQFGSDNPVVVTRLLKALGAVTLMAKNYQPAAAALADELLTRSLNQSGTESDRRYIRQCYAEHFGEESPAVSDSCGSN